MSQVIKIKRSVSTASPASLEQGELAYSGDSHKLFIGNPLDSVVIPIGGRFYVDMLDHTPGVVTPDSALIVDSNSKLDRLLVDNITINGATITGSTNLSLSASAELTLAASSMDLNIGTINADTQAVEWNMPDNEATALLFREGLNNYLTFVTTNGAEKVVVDRPLHIGTAYSFTQSDGTSGQALITDGNGNVTFEDVSTVLSIDGNTGSDNVELLTDTLTINGAGSISTNVTDNQVTISVLDATTSVKGVASFNTNQFSVSSGAVSSKQFTLGSTAVNLGTANPEIIGLERLTVDSVNINGNSLTTLGSNTDLTIAPNGEGVIKVPAGYKDRANFDDDTLVPKVYVDNLAQGLDPKDAVQAATTGNLVANYNNAAGTLTATSNGAINVDGQALVIGDRILVKDQSNDVQNGIYEVTDTGDGASPYVLTRAEDADESNELNGGSFVFVESGTVNSDSGWVFSHDGEPNIGVDSITAVQFSGAGQIEAGAGLGKSGNNLFVKPDDITTEINSDTVRIKGIGTTEIGDLLIGKAGNTGYSRLPKASVDGSILYMNSSGSASWSNIVDGGTY